MTPEQFKRVHVALESSGTIRGAARLLDMRPDALRNLVEKHPELKSYLKDTQPPDESETLAREALPVPAVSDQEVNLALASHKADMQVRRGLDAIGVQGAALEEAMAFRNFGRLHFEDMRHYIGGGVAKLFADLMADIREVRENIQNDAAIDPEEKRMLREDRRELIGLALKTYDRVREASLTAAVIEAKKREAEDRKKSPKGQPGFAPLAMQVKGDVTVVQPTSPQPPPLPAS